MKANISVEKLLMNRKIIDMTIVIICLTIYYKILQFSEPEKKATSGTL